MSDTGMSAPLQRGLRLEEMVIAAASGLQAEDAASRLPTLQEMYPAADAAPSDDSVSRDAGAPPARAVDTDATSATVTEAETTPAHDTTLQASLQAIRDSLDPDSHTTEGSPAADAPPPQPVHAGGTQIMPVGDIAQGLHILVPQSDALLTQAQDSVASLNLDHGIANVAPTALLGGTVAGVLQMPMPILAELTSEIIAPLNPLIPTIEHLGNGVGGLVSGLAGEVLATVPSLLGTGTDALAGLLHSTPVTSGTAGLGDDIATAFDHAVFSLPIGIPDPHPFDGGIAHVFHTVLPHAGSGLI